MMAKKRRRRRVEQAAPDVPPTASAAPELKTGEQGVGVEEQVQDAVAVDEEEEEDVDSSGAVVMPPLPSELGLDAVRVSQVGTPLLRVCLCVLCMSVTVFIRR